MSNMKFFKATLNEKKSDRNIGMPMPPMQLEVLFPFNAIASLKSIGNNEYEVFLREDFVPKVPFVVGVIKATIKKDHIEVV